jgi:hypothetical protein
MKIRGAVASTPLDPADEHMLRFGPADYRPPPESELARLEQLWLEHGESISASMRGSGRRPWFAAEAWWRAWVRTL